QKVDLRLQEVALCLCDQKRCRQANLEAALLGIQPLLGKRRTGPRRLDALGSAANLARAAAHRVGRLNAQAGNALLPLPALDLGARQAGILVAVTERVAHRHAEAPGRIVVGKDLPDRVAKPDVTRSDHGIWKTAGSPELRATQTRGGIRRLEAHVGQSLV